MRLWLPLLTAALSACSVQSPPISAALNGPRTLSAQAQASQEIIVGLKPNATPQALLQRAGVKARSRIAALNALVLTSPNRDATLAALKKDPAVLWAEPNGVVKLVRPAGEAPRLPLGPRAGGDPMLDQQWGMAKIEAPAVWSTNPGTPKVRVAVVDTGIYYRHAEFGDRVDPGFDFINRDYDARDDMMHGTHCAGIIGAGFNDGHGIVGVAPGVSLLAVKVMDQEGLGTFANIADGIIYAVQNRAQIINLSLGAQNTSYVMRQAIEYAVKAGVLVVAAMGNENTDAPSYPAAYPGVLAVGATKADDTRAGFSNVGSHISVSAPGHRILSTVLYGKYEAVSGTSMAAPHVAGLAALIKGAQPEWTAAQIKTHIEKTADDLGAPGFDPEFGHGRINVRRALSEAAGTQRRR